MALITTIYGDMDDSLLEKKEGGTDTPKQSTYWVEYRKPGNDEIIHRSVHMVLKEMPVFTKTKVN